MLAKLVSGLHKPDDQTVLLPPEVAEFVAPLPVRALPGMLCPWVPLSYDPPSPQPCLSRFLWFVLATQIICSTDHRCLHASTQHGLLPAVVN